MSQSTERDATGAFEDVGEAAGEAAGTFGAALGGSSGSSIESIRSFAQWDIVITYFQQLGVALSINIPWPSIFTDIFLPFTVPFSFNFERIKFHPTTVFYVKLALPLAMYACFKYAWTRPFAWKQSYILGWNMLLVKAAAAAALAGTAVFALLAFGLEQAPGAAASFAYTTAAFLFALWWGAATIGRIAYASTTDEHAFFVKARASIQTVSFFVTMLSYLPLVQSIVEVALLEMDQLPAAGSRGEPSAPAMRAINLLLVVVATVAYVIALPVGLFLQLRRRHQQVQSGSASTQAHRKMSTSMGVAPAAPESGDTLLLGGAGDSEGADGGSPSDSAVIDVTDNPGAETSPSLPLHQQFDFLQEGERAEQSRQVLLMLGASGSLQNDGVRRRAATVNYAQHSAREQQAFASALVTFQAQEGGDYLTRQMLPFDDPQYYWKAMQLGEKALLATTVGYAVTVSQSAEEQQLWQLILALSVTVAMLIASATCRPFRDATETKAGGTVVVTKHTEDRMDMVTRGAAVLNLAVAIAILKADDADAQKAQHYGVLLCLINLLNLAYLLVAVEFFSQLAWLYALAKGLPKRKIEAVQRRDEALAASAKRLRVLVSASDAAGVQHTLAAIGAQQQLKLIDDAAPNAEGDAVALAGADEGAISDGCWPAGSTTCHVAAQAGASGILRMLLQRGADTRKEDASGNTPLHIAYLAGKGGCVQVLLQFSAAEEPARADRPRPAELLDPDTAAQAAIDARSAADMRWLSRGKGEGGSGAMTDALRAKWARKCATAKAWEAMGEVLLSSGAASAKLGGLDLGSRGIAAAAPLVLRPRSTAGGGTTAWRPNTAASPHAPPQTVDLVNNGLFSTDAAPGGGGERTDGAGSAASADAAGVCRLLAERLGDADCDVRKLDLRGNGIGDDPALAAPLASALGAGGGSPGLAWLNGLCLDFALDKSDKSFHTCQRALGLEDEATLAAQLEAAEADLCPASGTPWSDRLRTLYRDEKMKARMKLQLSGPMSPLQQAAFEKEYMELDMARLRGNYTKESAEQNEARLKVEATNKIKHRLTALRGEKGEGGALEMIRAPLHLYESAFICRSLATSPSASQIVILNFGFGEHSAMLGDQGAVLLAAALRAPATSALRGGAHLGSLRELYLKENGVGDTGASALAKALASTPAAAPTTRRIEAGADEPAAVLHLCCVALQKLDLSKNKKIGPVAMRELALMLSSSTGCGRTLQEADFSYTGRGMYTDAYTELLKCFETALKPGAAPALTNLRVPAALKEGFPTPATEGLVQFF